MRIAITADPYLPIPPSHYGGIERVVDFVVQGLVSRGHEVTLFAHPGSTVTARLVPYGHPPHRNRLNQSKELIQVGSRLWKMRHEIDVVHSFGRLAALLPILPLRSFPKIQSYQREIPQTGVRRAHRISGGSLRFTACATHMYAGRGLPGVWRTVFNGVNLDTYSFVSEVAPDAPLVFLGRLERCKGPHHAIAIAKRAGRRLLIAGNVVRSGPDSGYFDQEVAPSIDGDRVRFVGEVDDGQKSELLGRASALLMPVEWDEPFGIVMVEAMACGTPVIAFDRGSVREVVRPGVNGFIGSDVDEAAKAVENLRQIRRGDVRRDAEGRFGSGVIVSEYISLYHDLIET